MKFEIKVKDTDRGFKSAMRNLKLMSAGLTVGIHDEDGDKAKITPKGETTSTVMDVATAHEYGIGVPERSFLRATYDENSAQYMAFIKAPFKSPENNGPSRLLVSMKMLGEFIRKSVIRRVKDGINPPLAESTIARKTANPGIEIETPLIWTGQLIDSVKSKVTTK